jgi:hypothetical protein
VVWLGLAAMLCLVTAPISVSAAAPARLQTVAMSGVVRDGDGAPIAGATVTVGDQPLLTDDQGRWHGAVPFASTLREFVSAPGYIQHSYREIYLPAPNASGPPLQDTLVSIFEPDPATYARPGSTPPTITGFVTDTAVSRSQAVPGDTTRIIVTGTVGDQGGEAVVRGDAYLGRPDDFVDQIAVSKQGGNFSAEFPITHGPGGYRVEINDSTGGAIINIPVFVGVPYQPEAPIWPDDGPVARALGALQQVRQSHGLAPYAVDPRLEKVAQDHVDDMLANNWICHCWANGSSVLDHVRAAGVEPARLPVADHPNQFTLGVGNGISTAPGAAAIRGLFASPGHRLDLLGSYTHIGIAYGGKVADGTSRLSIVYVVES